MKTFNNWNRNELISEITHLQRDQMEVIDDISRLNKKVAELTARVEQAEGRKKALRDKAILLYEEMKDIQFYNMSSWERRAYAVVQALAGNEEETA